MTTYEEKKAYIISLANELKAVGGMNFEDTPENNKLFDRLANACDDNYWFQDAIKLVTPIIPSFNY